ncbi:transporter substrate-binding domain-containing protein [Mycolicibacterium austroafricanum]|uniref:transporter substrate-binding domain-containing protein n=1 Tax=Mycolicibacterium austroafricanum TaxID=39687 RepID=UPI003AF37EB0
METPWDSIFAALEANRFDVVANQVTITPEREQKYDLSEPYSIGEGVILERGAPAAVIGDPKEERTRQFLQRILKPL